MNAVALGKISEYGVVTFQPIRSHMTINVFLAYWPTAVS